MRLGILRSDLGRGVYLADLASHNQYPYANGTPGEARTLRRATDAEVVSAVTGYPVPTFLVGTDQNANVDTSSNDTLEIRAEPGDAFTSIAVTSGVSTAKTVVRDDLNTAFGLNSLPFAATIVGTNQIQITSTVLGPTSYLEVDLSANSTLNTPLGFPDGSASQGLSYAALASAVRLATNPPPTVVGTDQNASVDTDPANALRIRASSLDAYSVISVTAGNTTAKTVVRDDLNTAFGTLGLPFAATIVGTNQIQIAHTGPGGTVDIDSVANGSTLSTPVGFPTAGTVVHSTIDVSEATVVAANAGFGELSAGDQTALAAAVADVIAPGFLETGDVLLSVASGKLSVLRALTFRPDGDRAGYPIGPAVYALADDGSTEFTYP